MRTTGNRDKRRPKPKAHVLTGNEAARLLKAAFEYYTSELFNGHVAGRHRAELLAEAMERDGLIELAGDVSAMHNALRRFIRGDITALRHFTDGESIDIMVEDAGGTKYAQTVKLLVAGLDAYTEILEGRGTKGIDWDKSATIVAKVKRETFPESLTMVEKLTHWQRDHSTGRLPRR